MSRMLLLLLCLASFTGCVSVASLADTLNERHVTSCVRGNGSYGLFFGVSILMATGGATIEECATAH